MAFINPCCLPLQAGVKLVSFGELICFFLILVLGIFYIVNGNHIVLNTYILSALIGPFFITWKAFLIAMSFAYFCLAILLWKAAIQRNEQYCKIWLILVVIPWIDGFFGVVFHIFPPEVNIIPFSLWILLQAYFIWVVAAFRNEILEQELIQDGQGITTGLVEQGTTTGAKYTASSHP